jgi:hypothetical protein
MKATTVLCVAAVVLAGATTALPGGQGVTLAMREFTNANRVRVLVFSGTIPNPEPNQDVEIVAEDCGVRGNRLFAATKTTNGGVFQVSNENVSTPYGSGVKFRARWNDRLSEPIQYRFPAPLYAEKVRGRRAWRVRFIPYELRVKYAGKPVELQRFSGGRWVRYRTARLKLKPSLDYGGAFNHEAVFTVPARGLRLRGHLPPQGAAPCWLPNSTEPWRS